VLDILIPSDPFTALSRNYLPAVVLFCLFSGFALQHVPEKAALLSVLEGIRLASQKFWNAVARFAPLAVIALFADLAGTTRLKATEEEEARFFFLFFAGALLLTFWIIPGCIAAFAPLQRKEVLREMRSAFLIVVATTLSVSALPYISSATQRLAQACGVDDPECGEIVRTSISVAYPLGQLGKFFVYLFVVFALFLNGLIVSPLETWFVPIVTFLSCIGSPTSSVDAVTFLARWLGLPDQTTPLYVSLMTLTRYGQVIASASGFAFLSFGVVLAYYGKIRIRWSRLLSSLAVALIASGGFVWAARSFDRRVLKRESNPYLSFQLDPDVTRGGNVSSPHLILPSASAGTGVLARIQQNGELRVGYNSGIIPFLLPEFLWRFGRL
jgi:sodium:dicarboxylate symporter family protein